MASASCAVASQFPHVRKVSSFPFHCTNTTLTIPCFHRRRQLHSLSSVRLAAATVKQFTSPRAKRRRLVNKNALLLKSIDDIFQKGRNEVKPDALKGLEKQAGFGIGEILRKYIRYTLNEKPFNPDVVANLIQLRKASLLDDSQVAEILNEISQRIVKEKGPVVTEKTGYTEKGFKRKLAVQALFGKVFYLSELPEFCSRDSSLVVKEIFGVTDEDANELRIHTLSDSGDMDSLQKMVDGSDTEDSSEESSDAPGLK
ncbi:Ribosomal RNA small subunit methyltransferase J [Quillaja saponaria]|uniref:Ribosomal RNA small subunit methyltransferase J n=1 Tax=Quillaja saponaria TaxID=32244 RepID=A0AAD7PH32_QUISA|nr:Ribosomal RNA small subunit methyltransferase J [Quillaja saponaria]